MTDTTELAHLRAELSNPAVGSKDHLQKLALLLVEALEKAKGMETYWKTQCRGITDHCEELQARIAELEFRTVKLPEPTDDKFWRNDWDATHFMYAAYVEDLKVELSAAGIKWEAE